MFDTRLWLVLIDCQGRACTVEYDEKGFPVYLEKAENGGRAGCVENVALLKYVAEKAFESCKAEWKHRNDK